MNRIYSLAALIAVTLYSAGPVHGAPKLKAESPSTEAKMMFEDIDTQSVAISEEASGLRNLTVEDSNPEGHVNGLMVIKDDVNRIGRELQSLEADRDSLSAWEAKALDQTTPLMREVADNADQAIQTLSTGRPLLWAGSYVDNLAKISRDADQVTTLLHSYLKLEKTREKELRLEHSLGGASGF